MLVRFLFAALPLVVLAQTTGPEPVAWVRDPRYTKGKWFDEQHKRELIQGDEVFSDSRIVRRQPKSRKDVLALRLPDGQPIEFSCSQPLTCEEPLSLNRIVEKANPRLVARFQRVFNTMSGQRLRLGGLKLEDAILVPDSGGLQISAVLRHNLGSATYSFSWCLNALEEPCPEPRPFTVRWDPAHPPRIPAKDVPPGLHLLGEVADTEGLWLYTDHFAYILVTDKANADRLRPQFKALLKELSGYDSARARMLAVVFLAAQS